MLQINLVGKIKIHVLYSITFVLRKSYRLWYDVETYGGVREAADDILYDQKYSLCDQRFLQMLMEISVAWDVMRCYLDTDILEKISAY